MLTSIPKLFKNEYTDAETLNIVRGFVQFGEYHQELDHPTCKYGSKSTKGRSSGFLWLECRRRRVCNFCMEARYWRCTLYRNSVSDHRPKCCTRTPTIVLYYCGKKRSTHTFFRIAVAFSSTCWNCCPTLAPQHFWISALRKYKFCPALFTIYRTTLFTWSSRLACEDAKCSSILDSEWLWLEVDAWLRPARADFRGIFAPILT